MHTTNLINTKPINITSYLITLVRLEFKTLGSCENLSEQSSEFVMISWMMNLPQMICETLDSLLLCLQKMLFRSHMDCNRVTKQQVIASIHFL